MEEPVKIRCRDRVPKESGILPYEITTNGKRSAYRWIPSQKTSRWIHSLELFGKTFRYPVFAGPVGAVSLHYGDCLDDVAYNDILVSACAENGIAAFTGDGVDSNVMVAATAAIKKAGWRRDSRR